MNKNYLLKIVLTGILFFAFYLCGNSQTQELGLRLSGLENFDFIYKKEKSENKFRRYRLGLANIGFISQNDNESVSAQIGFAIGTENRRAINEKLLFVHGFEPFISLGISTNRAVTNLNIQSGLGYVLGFQYTISEEFYVNIETIPSLNLGVRLNENVGNVYAATIGFNSNAVALTVAYRFTEKIFK